jgi:HEAT repeat protein
VMNGRAELEAMYANETSRDLREEIMQALFIAGDSDKLSQLARGEKDPDLRGEAIRRLGLMGSKTGPLLMQLYNAESSTEVKHAVIDGLFVQSNSRALIELAKKETDRSLRREILQKLSVMGDEDAVQYMLQILEQ